MTGSKVFQFGSFEVASESGEIRKNGVLIRLAPQPFQVLLLLIERAGQLVDREELHRLLWGDDQLTVEFDAGLNRCIRQIRAALADNADAPRYIETEPRKGYRFIAAVETINRGGHVPPTATRVGVPTEQKLSQELVVPPSTPTIGTSHTSKVHFHLKKWSFAATGVVAVLVVAAVYFLTLEHRRNHEPVSFTTVPLATGLGAQYSPTFSPDGKEVAFIWNPEHRNNFDIYRKVVGESSVTRLTTNSDIDYSPVWSPDGRWIAFCNGSNAYGGAVWLLPASGGSERKLIDLKAIGDPGTRALSWSHDSKHLVVAERLASSLQAGLTVVDIETGAWRQLLTARPGEILMQPAVSPDGNVLAFTNDTGNGVSAIWLLQFPGGLQPKLLSGQFANKEFRSTYNAQPAWTPDGSHVVFSSNADGEHHLWLAAVNSPVAPQSLASLGDNLERPDVSRVGQLAAEHGVYDRNIWRMEIPGNSMATSHLPGLAIASTRDDGEPSISPDGSRIAFASNRDGYSEIWISMADGSKPAPATAMRNPITGSPSWSPDGSRIAFDSRADGHPQIYIMPVSGGAPKKLNCGPVSNVVPVWSPDGKWIYYSSDQSGQMEIWRVSLTGSVPEQVTTGSGFGGKFSPDGSLLYYTTTKSRLSTLWRVNLRTRSRTPIAASVFKRAYVPVSNGIYYFSQSAAGDSVLLFYNVKDEKKTSIFSTDRLIDGGATIDPAGRFLYFTQVDQNSHDLLLANEFWK